MRVVVLMVVAGLVAGCSWVKLNPEGEKIRVLDIAEVSTCQKKGETTVSLMSKVAGIKRSQEKMQEELAVLARNVAPDSGGDTVVAISEAVEGKQTYAIYKCVGVR